MFFNIVEHVCSAADNMFFVVHKVVGVLNSMIIIIVQVNHTCGQMSLQPLPLLFLLKRDNCLQCRYITTSLIYIHGLVMFGLDSLRLQLS